MGLQYILEKYFLDIFFAKRCLSCGVNKSSWLCTDCHQKILRNMEGGSFGLGDGAVCKYFFDFKDGPLRELLHSLKYGGIWDLGEVIAGLLAQAPTNKDFCWSGVIVPVPVCKKRLSERGYNQVEMIANGLGSLFDLRVCANFLRRVGGASSQVGKGREERVVSLNNQFEIENGRGMLDFNEKIILMDDVVVTGSTLMSCRKALIDAGYNNIQLVAVAREL